MKKQHNTKVLLAILMVVIMVSSLALSACGKTASPSDITTAELKAFQTEDTAELAKAVVAGDDVTFPDEFLKQLQEFTYKIDSEKVDGDKAVVSVTISTYDLGTAYNTSIVQVVKDYYTAALAGTAGTEEELTQDMFNAFFEAAKSTEKNYTKTVDVTLDKTDDGWTFNETENGDLIAAIWGGFMEAATEFAENAGDEAYINELIGK
jgi:major membrane immunogen (membrane-anchored lipoprotein)